MIAEKATLITCATDTLFHTKDLPFTIGQLPDVFTHFRKQVEQRSRVRPIIPAPKRMTTPALPDLRIPALADLGFAVPATDKRAVLHFKGCIDAAHERITHYFEQTHCIARYKETRNGLVGADYSSKFSPWLAQGCVSAREVYYRLQQYEAQFGANDSTYWLVFELLWRDYFHFAMQRYGHLFFRRTGIKKDAPPAPAHREKTLQAWMEGTTGVDFVDANMRELRLTGFMSNRGRQNVASYLINDLKIDWRYGAAWMEQQLIDYDVCSNWGNWCYLAGVGNDPRSNRYFNIAKQARDYDADGTYRRLWRQ
ncbi:MAG: DASH family cryptochrome [Chitinophagia bacterium]|nr:DASH family cryptochrome [Chitinophagia bacterium]